jgi:hypothetical protein
VPGGRQMLLHLPSDAEHAQDRQPKLRVADARTRSRFGLALLRNIRGRLRRIRAGGRGLPHELFAAHADGVEAEQGVLKGISRRKALELFC